MDCEAPGEMVAVIFGGSIVGFVGWRGGVWRIGRFSARVEVVEEAERIVPFQRYAFVWEP
jgi:hypothetical protein